MGEKTINEIARNSMLAVLVCFLFLLAYLYFEKQHFMIDKTVLILLFAGLGFLFLPSITRLVKRLKISSFELELSSIDTRTFVGEVVQTDTEKYYYIAKEGISVYSLQDRESADILKSYKGILQISKDKLKSFGTISEMESAKTANILRSKNQGDVFIILNRKKFYISSYAPLIDMNRRDDIKDVDEEELRKYETGR